MPVKYRHKPSSSWLAYMWIMLLGANILLRIYKVGELPIGMDYDHVREAYQASELLKHFDVIVDNILFLQLFAIRMFQKILGLGVISNYVNASFWFILSLLPLYWLTKDLFGKDAARWGVILVSFSIIGFTASRMGQVSITAPFFAFLALFAFYRLLRTGTYRYVWLLGVTLGLGVYSFPVFKGVFLTFPGFLALVIGMDRCFKSPGPNNTGYVNALWKFCLVGVIFLGIVSFFPFGAAKHSFSWNRLYQILIGYTSNGVFVRDFPQFVQNSLQLLSQFLPVKYVRYHHFIIPRFTGNAEAKFYISPVITLFFLIFLCQCAYVLCSFFLRRLSAFSGKIGSISAKSESVELLDTFFVLGRSRRWIITRWRKEYDWLFGICIFLGGCSTALLSDHAAARRWIYGWFWIYPLAAVGLVSVAQKFSLKLLAPLLVITLASQMYLIYNPYLIKPWRTNGPTVAIIAEMKRYCENSYDVYTTPIVEHWGRYYRKLQPLGDCKLHIISEGLQPPTVPYVRFDIINNYGPVKFPGTTRTIEKKDDEKGTLVTEFSDQWGFFDFRVTEMIGDNESYRRRLAAEEEKRKERHKSQVERHGQILQIEHPLFDIGVAQSMFDENQHTLVRSSRINPARIVIQVPSVTIQHLAITISHNSQVTISVKTHSNGVTTDWGKQYYVSSGSKLGVLTFTQPETITGVTQLDLLIHATDADQNGYVHLNEIAWE